MILFILAAVMACYANMLQAGFVWDDEYLVVQNPLVRAPIVSMAVFKQDIVNSGFTTTIYYRPLQILSYALDYRLWGMKPFGMHLSSILLHFLNALAVFFFTRRITADKAAALLTAVIFAVHPAHAGAVSYISGRADLLFFFFGFLFLTFFRMFTDAERKDYLLLAAALACLAFSLLSKEGALIFPLLAVFTDAVLPKKHGLFRFVYHVPALVLAGSYVFLHHVAFGARYAAVMRTGDLAAGAAKYLSMAGEFMVLGFVPLGLHMRRAASGPAAAAASCVAVLCVLAVLFLSAKRRTLFFALGFFLIALLPFVLVVGYFGVFAEHWMYLASYGLFLFLSVAFSRAYAKAARSARVALILSLFLLLLFYSLSTMAQNVYWQNSIALSDRVLGSSGVDAPAKHFKAVSLLKTNRPEDAKEVMRTYTDKDPNDPRSWYIKGRMSLAAEDKEAARECFRKSIALDPRYDNGYFGLGLMALLDGDDANGIKLLEKAAEMNPSNVDALLLLGTAYSGSGDNKKALEATRKAYKADPYDYNVLVNMGTVNTRMGAAKEGAMYYLEAYRLYPERPVPSYNLGYIFYLSGQKEEAEIWLRKALKADPEFKPAAELLRKMREEK